MKLPKAGTILVLSEDAPHVDGVRKNHGWLYKFDYWDIHTDHMILTSVATGCKVYAGLNTFKRNFEELADGT